MQQKRTELSGGYSLSGPPRDSMNLLQEIVEHPIDDDYYVASERPRSQRPVDRGARRMLSTAAVAVFALLIVIAAVQTYEQRPETESEREALVAQIHEREATIASLQDRIDTVSAEVEALEAGASDPDYDERVVNESIAVGKVAVTGPGAEILVDNAEDFETQPQGEIRDTDLQLLVNGLWNAGAEAIAVNGQRITSMTSIRTAGEAITVNYRSLTAPYTVQAIGDMDTLAARFLETPAGSEWSSLANNYGVQLEVRSVPELSLPAAPPRRLTVRHAMVKGDSE